MNLDQMSSNYETGNRAVEGQINARYFFNEQQNENQDNIGI